MSSMKKPSDILLREVKASKMGTRELARAVGVNASVISKMRTGSKRGSAETLDRLAEYFGYRLVK